MLPMPMACWGGTVWYRLGAREIDRTSKQRAPRRPVSPAVIRTGSQFFAQRRSEEHTSELQSPCNLVCRLLLEKKKKREQELSCQQELSQQISLRPI